MKTIEEHEAKRLESITPDARMVTVYVTDLDVRPLLHRWKPDPRPSQVALRITDNPPQFRVYELRFELIGKVSRNKRGMRVDAAFLVRDPDDQKVPGLDDRGLNYLGEVLTDAVKTQHNFNRVAPISGDKIMMD